MAKNGQNPARRPKTGPSSGQTATYRKTKVIQSYLRMWGCYDPIGLDPSDPKKWGLYGRSVKKCRFWGQKCCFSAQNPFFSDIVQNFCYHHDWTPKRQHFCVDPVARRAAGRPPGPIFGPKICVFLRYAYITPIFSAPTHPTQWDNNLPIS